MKKMILIFVLLICVGIVFLSSCSNGEIESDPPENSVSDIQSIEKNTESNDENKQAESESTTENSGNIESSNNDNQPDPNSLFADGNEAFNTADLTGNLSECTSTGCTFSNLITEGSIVYASSDPISVTYDQNTEFLNGTFNIDGSDYSISYCDVNGLTDGAMALVFGSLQDDGTYLAKTVIVYEYN